MEGKMRGSRKNIDKVQFEKLCAMFCTNEEICAFFGVSHDTMLRWCQKTYGMTFEDTYKVKNAMGRVSLRRAQMELAKTNPTMAIWLGKVYLGQSEEQKEDKSDMVSALGEIVGKIQLVTKEQVMESREEGVSASND